MKDLDLNVSPLVRLSRDIQSCVIGRIGLDNIAKQLLESTA
jgi:hypothetical protein